MTRDEILSMAREAGLFDDDQEPLPEYLEHFAALVAEREREATLAKSNASWKLMCQKMVEVEREACAKVCENIDVEYDGEEVLATWCAGAIRARSTK